MGTGQDAGDGAGRAGPRPYAAVGTVLADRYRVEAVIGSGGMATVFRARDLARDGASVAVKLLRSEFSGDPEAVERLRREGQVLEALEHPGIVSFEAQGVLPDGRLFLAMELLEGETLGDRLRRVPRMDPADLSPVVRGVAGALAAAHEAGVVHRDLKPDNVFLVDGGDRDPGGGVKLLDFGISKVYGSASLTRTGQIVGTPRYMAPEQLLGEGDLDVRVDVYALGVMLYEALAGTPPYVGSAPADLVVAILNGQPAPLDAARPDLPPELTAVVMRALSRAREARPASATAFAEAWQRAVGPVGPPRGIAAERGPKMRTATLGRMEPPGGPRRPSRDELVPGTFQEMPAAGPDAVAGPARVAPEVGAASPPAAAPPAAVPRPPPSEASGDGWRDSFPPMDAASTTTTTLPLRGPGWGTLAAVGLLLGAGTAAAAVAWLRPWDDGSEVAPASDIIQRTPPVEPTPAGGAGPVLVPDPVDEPTGDDDDDGDHGRAADAPDRSETDGSAARRPRRRSPRRGARSGGGVDPRSTPGRAATPGPGPGRAAPAATGHDEDGDEDKRWVPVPPDPAPAASAPDRPPTVSALLREARAALRAGRPLDCLRLVEQAQSRGAPPISLRLEGDCLLRAGRAADARKTFERFCRLEPDHPSIPELTRQVENLGGSCVR